MEVTAHKNREPTCAVSFLLARRKGGISVFVFSNGHRGDTGPTQSKVFMLAFVRPA